MRRTGLIRAACVILVGTAFSACNVFEPNELRDEDITFANLTGESMTILAVEAELVLQSGLNVLSGTISYELTNLSERTISIPNCNGTYQLILERLSGDRWVEAMSGAMMMGCISPPIVVAPGEVLTDSMLLVAGQPGTTTYPQFVSAPDGGHYRLALGAAYWDFDAARGEGVLLPERLRISNEFTIRID